MYRLQWVCVFSLIAIVGCALSQAPRVTALLDVDFSWEGTSRCSERSPEIRVANIPAETKTFDVTLKDLDAPLWNHGWGTFPNDGSGIIPPGALDKGYNGPCPPDHSHRYRFTVKAVNEAGDVIASGSAMHEFP